MNGRQAFSPAPGGALHRQKEPVNGVLASVLRSRTRLRSGQELRFPIAGTETSESERAPEHAALGEPAGGAAGQFESQGRIAENRGVGQDVKKRATQSASSGSVSASEATSRNRPAARSSKRSAFSWQFAESRSSGAEPRIKPEPVTACIPERRGNQSQVYRESRRRGQAAPRPRCRDRCSPGNRPTQ